jgi:hypothetical protein
LTKLGQIGIYAVGTNPGATRRHANAILFHGPLLVRPQQKFRLIPVHSLDVKLPVYLSHSFPSISQGATMIFNNSPLEVLAAFPIVFVSGALSAIGLVKYIEKVKKNASGANPSN